MASIVGIVSRHGLRNEAHRRNQPSKSKLVLYRPLLHFHSHVKQLYMSNKTKCFSYKSGHGMRGHTHMEMFKEELAWAKDTWLRVISSMLFKTVIPLRD